MRSLAFLRLIPLLSLFVATARAAEPADIVREFYLRASGGDVAGAASLWTRDSAPQFVRRQLRVAAVRCARVEQLEARPGREDGGTVTVDVTATLAEWKIGELRERLVQRASRFRLQGNASGSWEIAGWVEREQELADQLTAIDDREARIALLRKEPELATPELGLLLTKRAMLAVNERRIAAAWELVELARGIATETGDPRLEAAVVSAEGVLVRFVPDFPRALALARTSAGMAAESGDPDVRASTILRLIRALASSEIAIPDELFEEGLALADRVEDLATIGLIATQAAQYYDDRSGFRRGLTYSLLAEKLAQESGDVSARISAQLNLGGAMKQKADCALARPYYERAIELARSANFPAVHASTLIELALCSDEKTGVLLAEESIAIARRTHSPAAAVHALLYRAWTHIGNGELAAAEEDLELACAEEAVSDEPARNRLNGVLSELRYREGRFTEALALVEPVTMPGECYRRARIYRALGRHAEAEKELEAGIAEHAGMRDDIAVDPRQVREYQQKSFLLYDELIDLLVDCGRAESALQTSEGRKAKILRDVLGGAGIPADSFLFRDEREQRNELELRLTKLNTETPDNGTTAEDHRRDVILARRELADLHARIYARHPDLRWRSAPIPDEVPIATNGIAYVSYDVLDEKTIVFVVAPPGGVTVSVLPIGATALRQRVRQFVRQIETRDLAVGRSAEALYDLLLRPVARRLMHARRVCIVPAGELWRLPFQALKPTPRSWLVETMNIFYAPSIEIAASLAQRPVRSTHRLLAFANGGDDDAAIGATAAAEWEVKHVAPLYRSRLVRTGAAADESSFVHEAPAYDILHIAGHALLDDSAPMYSAVMLAAAPNEDGRVEARELASMKLDARLAVISACETGRGDSASADGVVGLPWALIAAGVRSSVVSLWRVDSAATARLMLAFHRELAHSRFRSVSGALATAQRSLIRSEHDSHPYYWAPFVAIGGD